MLKHCLNPQCPNPDFNTDFTQKDYCSVKCKRRAKELRALERDSQRNQVVTDSRVYAQIVNPTIEQLAALSLVYAAKANNVPTLVSGIIPQDWKAPKGVDFRLQVGSNPPVWLMQSGVEDIMEMFKRGGDNATISIIEGDEGEKPVEAPTTFRGV